MKLNFVKSIKATFEGLFTVFKHLFKKPVTLEYPEKKRVLPDTFRGKLSVENCCGCGICKKVCPTGAISYEKNEQGKVTDYKIDLKRCIFCSNCVIYCPKGAIKMTKEYELATDNPEDLVLHFERGENND